HNSCPCCQAYTDDEAKYPLCGFVLDACIKPFPCTTRKPYLLMVFTAECLHNAERSQNLLHHGGGGAFQRRHPMRQVAQMRTIRLRHQQNDRRNRQSDQRKLPVDPRCHVNHSKQRDKTGKEWDSSFKREITNVGGIPLNAKG